MRQTGIGGGRPFVCGLTAHVACCQLTLSGGSTKGYRSTTPRYSMQTFPVDIDVLIALEEVARLERQGAGSLTQ